MKMKIKIRPIVSILCITIALLITSCVDGFKEGELFSSGVTGVTLESPKANNIVFAPSADGTEVTISWPVVYGSGGYQFSLYNVDDPTKPVSVGLENETVDGCSVKRELLEDTKYKVVIKTLGNEKSSNKEAATASESLYSTLLVATVIPSGTDLTQYFATNPIPSSTTELAYELESGGTYTMSGDVKTGLTNVTLRGNKIHHPTVTMSAGAFISDGAGLKLKFIDFNCAAFTGKAFIAFNAIQNPAVIANSWVTVTAPIAVQSCKITGLAKELLDDNNKKYAVQTLLIKNSIIGQNSTNQYFIYMQGGIIKDLNISNSTIYNTQVSTSNFIQYNASNRVTSNAAWNWASASVAVTNSTFWQVAKLGQMANYSGIAQKNNDLIIQKNIFVDCGNQAVIRRFAGGNTNMTRKLDKNSYWFAGVFVTAEISANYDNSGSHISTDPALKDPANADFTVGGAEQISARTGDPRWLPIQ